MRHVARAGSRDRAVFIIVKRERAAQKNDVFEWRRCLLLLQQCAATTTAF
jgi:hypothetical protein